MGNDDCPLCSASMEVRNVAPCEQCGGDPESLDRFGAKNQTYHLVRVLGGRELILCTGCMLDFGLLDPNFLGVPPGVSYGFENMEIVREINSPAVRADNFLPGVRVPPEVPAIRQGCALRGARLRRRIDRTIQISPTPTRKKAEAVSVFQVRNC